MQGSFLKIIMPGLEDLMINPTDTDLTENLILDESNVRLRCVVKLKAIINKKRKTNKQKTNQKIKLIL